MTLLEACLLSFEKINLFTVYCTFFDVFSYFLFFYFFFLGKRGQVLEVVLNTLLNGATLWCFSELSKHLNNNTGLQKSSNSKIHLHLINYIMP